MSIFAFIVCFWSVKKKITALSKDMDISPFFQHCNYFISSLYMLPILMNIFIQREIKIQFHSLSKRLSTLCVFDSLVENQLTRNVCIYFSVLYSVSLVFVSAFMPEPCCFHYDNFLVYFEIGQGEVSSFRILVQDSFGYFCLFCLYMSLGAVFLLLRKIPLKFCSNYICSRRVSLELK